MKAKPKPTERYAVITTSAQGRHFTATEEEAIAHAQRLFSFSGRTNTDEFLVVKVISRVRRSPPLVNINVLRDLAQLELGGI